MLRSTRGHVAQVVEQVRRGYWNALDCRMGSWNLVRTSAAAAVAATATATGPIFTWARLVHPDIASVMRSVVQFFDGSVAFIV